MHTVRLAAPDDVAGWRAAARALAAQGVPAEAVLWQVGAAPADLFAAEAGPAPAPAAAAPPPGFTVPRAFLSLAEAALLHRAPDRFALLYRLLRRLQAQPRLMADQADPELRRAAELAKAVRRDLHKMRAFLRFREVAAEDGARFIAWFEPDHHIVRANARFFVNRFAALRWSILTPDVSLHWEAGVLREGPGATRAEAPGDDPVEALWASYFASIFNPARVKIGAMLKEMPRKYWKNLPETALVPQLIAGAQAREARMIDAGAPAPAEDRASAWARLREEAAACTRCPLHAPATQMVFGEGPADPVLLFVGEQPGDQEDLAGRPFIGPAGQLFDRALAEAGIERARAYVTNAVKHFKFEPRGKRRIHAKPDTAEISACHWWLAQERRLLRPRLTVMLGATAARSLLGRSVTISRERGRALPLAEGGMGWITVHPSYLLRLPESTAAEAEYRAFVTDLRAAAAWAAGGG